MNTLEYLAVVQAERSRQVEAERLARLVARVGACCRNSIASRVLRTLRRAPAAC